KIVGLTLKWKGKKEGAPLRGGDFLTVRFNINFPSTLTSPRTSDTEYRILLHSTHPLSFPTQVTNSSTESKLNSLVYYVYSIAKLDKLEISKKGNGRVRLRAPLLGGECTVSFIHCFIPREIGTQ